MDSNLGDFSNSLRVVAKHFKKKMHSDSVCDKDYTMKDCRIIDIIGSDKKTMSELSQELELTPGSTTTYVDKLIEFGLVERVYDKKDRRRIFICLSKEGLKIYKMFCKKYLEVSKDLLVNLSDKEKETFIKLMKKSSEGLAKND